MSELSHSIKRVEHFYIARRDGDVTDNEPVSKPVTNFARYCTVYDDNYTFSAARLGMEGFLEAGSADSVDVDSVGRWQ